MMHFKNGVKITNKKGIILIEEHNYMKKYKMRISEIITAFALMLLLSACSTTSISQTGEPKNADKSITIEDTSADMDAVSIDGVTSAPKNK